MTRTQPYGRELLPADVITAAASSQALDWFFQGVGDTLFNVAKGEHIKPYLARWQEPVVFALLNPGIGVFGRVSWAP